MMGMHKRLIASCALALALALAMALGLAESNTAVAVGLDYSEGEYGETETSSTWQISLTVRHETGPFLLKLNVPYVRSSGLAALGATGAPRPGTPSAASAT